MTDSERISESVIQDLEAKRYRAVLEQDFATFDDLCHDELVYSHSGGNRDSRQDYTAKLRTGTLRYHRIENSIESITIIGNTALVLGRMKADLTVNGTDKTINNSSLAVWIQEGDEWKFVAYQPTPPRTPKDLPSKARASSFTGLKRPDIAVGELTQSIEGPPSSSSRRTVESCWKGPGTPGSSRAASATESCAHRAEHG